MNFPKCQAQYPLKGKASTLSDSFSAYEVEYAASEKSPLMSKFFRGEGPATRLCGI